MNTDISMNSWVTRGLFLGMGLGLMACTTEDSMLKDVRLTTNQRNGDLHIGVQTKVELGQTQFPILEIPVFDRQTGRSYGTISLKQGVDGADYLGVDVNVSRIANLPAAADPLLPNYQTLPYVGLNDTVVLQVGDNSQVYVGFAQDKVILGMAVAVDGFDNIGAEIPGSQLFFRVEPEKYNGVDGLFGIFTSEESGKSGIAVFVDITDEFLKNRNGGFNALDLASADPVQVDLSNNMSKKEQRRLGWHLWKMRNKKLTLSVK